MKRNYFNVILLLCFSIIIAWSVEGNAQPSPFAIFGEIEGYIVNCEGDAAPDVQVYLSGISFMARTDEDGYFRLVNVPEGSYQLVVDNPGVVSQPVEVFNRKTTSLGDIEFCPCITNVYEDRDHDNFGDENLPVCPPPPPEDVEPIDSGYAWGPFPTSGEPAFPFDCNDLDPGINPSVPENCCDGIDNNCSGLVDDEGECEYPLHFIDGDGDNFGLPESETQTGTCSPTPGYTDGPPADCDDTDGTIHPGAPEICGDETDQDCDGNDCLPECMDGDGDGYQSAICGGPDCDDSDSDINPGIIETPFNELCGDGIDNDCDGFDATCVAP